MCSPSRRPVCPKRLKTSDEANGFYRTVGVVQAIFVLAVALPALHPRIANEQYGPTVARQLEPPGFLGLHYGIRTPISVVIAHIIFGTSLGRFLLDQINRKEHETQRMATRRMITFSCSKHFYRI